MMTLVMPQARSHLPVGVFEKIAHPSFFGRYSWVGLKRSTLFVPQEGCTMAVLLCSALLCSCAAVLCSAVLCSALLRCST